MKTWWKKASPNEWQEEGLMNNSISQNDWNVGKSFLFFSGANPFICLDTVFFYII